MSIKVQFETAIEAFFYEDGTYFKGQTPSLKKIEIVKVERWSNVYSSGDLSSYYYHSEEDAKKVIPNSPKVIATVKLTGEYEAP